MRVSAVLPVFNGEKFVAGCIESLLAQSKKFDEIIVVDDGSSDSTVKICRGFGVKIIEPGHVGRSRARNLGLRKARHEIVFFVESDAVYSKNFLADCLKHFSDSDVGGVIGKLEVRNRNESAWTRCRAAELDSRFSDYKPFTAWMYRKGVVEKLGGFDERIDVGEDTLLGEKVRRSGLRLVYEPNAVWKHLEPASLRAVLRKSWQRGLGLGQKHVVLGLFPKILPADAIFFAFFFMGILNVFFLLAAFAFICAQLFVRRKQFFFIGRRFWPHLVFFLVLNILAFKAARLLGTVFFVLKGA
ncbi:MAG: glycosyltransferase [Candidatus Diapherotrites archaeon]|nr:glycosyltransferase [Candidatus Diapherotrites archaeon]